MGGGDLNMKKSWHPLLMSNQERVWKEEKRALAERKKTEQLRRELEEERQMQELQRLQEEAGGKQKQEKMDWMYATPAQGSGPDAGELEEYLLGKKRVDKLLRAGDTEKLSNQSKETFIAVQNANTARDTAAKIREDPLLAIKQQEQQAYQTLLKDPSRLRQLRAAQGLPVDDGKGKGKEKSKERRKEERRREKEERRAEKERRRRGESPDGDRRDWDRRDVGHLRERNQEEDLRRHSRHRFHSRSPPPSVNVSGRGRYDDPRDHDRHDRPRSSRRDDDRYSRYDRKDDERRSGPSSSRRSISPPPRRRDDYGASRSYHSRPRSSSPPPKSRDAHHDGGRSGPQSNGHSGHVARGSERRPSPSPRSGSASSAAPPGPTPADLEAQRAARLAAMMSNAQAMSSERAAYVERIKAEEAAEQAAEEALRAKRAKEKGEKGASFLRAQEKLVWGGEGGLGERMRRGKVGLVKE